MIGLDTNVLVRYLTQDDPAQSAQANACIARELSTAACLSAGDATSAETADKSRRWQDGSLSWFGRGSCAPGLSPHTKLRLPCR